MCCPGKFYSIVFIAVILTELVCGLIATGASAFCGCGTSSLIYLFFAIYTGFAIFLIYYSVKEVRNYENTSSSFNWISGLCTVFTIVTFVGLFVLVKPKGETEGILMVCTGLVVASMFILGCTVECFTREMNLGWINSPKLRSQPPRVEYQRENGAGGGERTLDQSLAQIVNHVHSEGNHPQKGYQMYAPGSGTPFQVVV